MARAARSAKEAFGGVKISFDKVRETTLGSIFGLAPLSPAEMVKKLWAFIAREGLKIAAAEVAKRI